MSLSENLNYQFKFYNVKLFFLFILLGNIFAAQAYSQVYKCKDKSGSIIFCNDPSKSLSKDNVDLKKIYKEDIQEVKTNKLSDLNCKNRGGIDCSKGADKDGSVICIDGFTDAIKLFDDYCIQTKLEITTVVLNKKTFEIFIRNNKEIEGRDISLAIQSTWGEKFIIKEFDKIGGYGGELVKIKLNKLPLQKNEIQTWIVNCKNCKSESMFK